MDRQPPPPLLVDTLKRIKIDEQLQDFIDQMNSDAPWFIKSRPQTQLWLLSQTHLWPESKTLRFLNAKGETVWEHKGRENAAVAQIHEAQMHNGDLLKTLLETLDESERKTCLRKSSALLPKCTCAPPHCANAWHAKPKTNVPPCLTRAIEKLKQPITHACKNHRHHRWPANECCRRSITRRHRPRAAGYRSRPRAQTGD